MWTVVEVLAVAKQQKYLNAVQRDNMLCETGANIPQRVLERILVTPELQRWRS